MAGSRNGLRSFFEGLLLFFLISLFLKLGTGSLEHPVMKFWYAGVLIVGFVSIGRIRQRWFELRQSPSCILFLSFMLFEVARSLWGLLRLMQGNVGRVFASILRLYLISPIPWFFYIGFFVLSFFFFRGRKELERLLWLLAWMGFVLSLTVIPPLLMTGNLGYGGVSGGGFFPSIVYFHPFVEKYLVSRYAHVNYVGDVIALGFFPAAALLLYSLQRFVEAVKSGKDYDRPQLSMIGLQALFMGATALAVILLFSRGTIISFAFGFLVFLLAALVKFFSRQHILLLGLVFLVAGGFVVWAANLQATWKEVATSKKEVTGTQEESSFSTNREGAKRALAIYHDFPVWGVGHRGYARMSQQYATPGKEKINPMSILEVSCHYLQILAEQGVGAYIYFVFLLVWILEAGWLLFKTESRFQFIAALSLSSYVLMILVHAAIKPVMEYFAIATPVYLLMGATLASLRTDFVRS